MQKHSMSPTRSYEASSLNDHIMIFVYGTLKTGHENHSYLKNQTFIARARTLPIYSLIDLGTCPGMITSSQDGIEIEGELWNIDQETRIRIDKLEGTEEGIYTLEPVKLAPPFETKKAFAYFYKLSSAEFPRLNSVWPR